MSMFVQRTDDWLDDQLCEDHINHVDHDDHDDHSTVTQIDCLGKHMDALKFIGQPHHTTRTTDPPHYTPEMYV